jgi:hypothetical protein
LAVLSAKTAPRQRFSWQDVVAADVSMSSRGVVPSAMAESTAGWPHADAIAGPGVRAAGEVMLPCAEASVLSAAMAARYTLTIFRECREYITTEYVANGNSAQRFRLNDSMVE